MGESRPPPFVICHLCGRKYGTKSIGIHVPQCEKKWDIENRKLPHHLRRRFPSQPDYGILESGDSDAIEQINEMAFKAAQAQLIPCNHCGRTFYPEKLPVHQRSCTAEKPFRPPRSKTTATGSRNVKNVLISNDTKKTKTDLGKTWINSNYTTNNTTTKQPKNDLGKTWATNSNYNAKPRSKLLNNEKTILCTICMKQIPKKQIQTHLVSCNEEKIKELQNSGMVNGTEKEVARPKTRTIIRKPPSPSETDEIESTTEPEICFTSDDDSRSNTRTMNRSKLEENSLNFAATFTKPSMLRLKSQENELAATFTSNNEDGTYDIIKANASYSIENSVVVDQEFYPCNLCNRKFTADRINQHKVICSKLKKKERKTFDSSKQRLMGLEIRNIKKQSVAKNNSKTIPKSNWRQKHEEFIRSIRAAKQVSVHMAKGGKASDIPPPPPSLNPDYIHCQYCDRRFNPEVAARHIPKCATTTNRPTPPKKKALDVYRGEQKGKHLKNLKKSETFSVRQNTSAKLQALLGGNENQVVDKKSSLKKSSSNNSSGYISPRLDTRYGSFEKLNNSFRSATSLGSFTSNSSSLKNDPKKTSPQKVNSEYSYNSVNKRKPHPKSAKKFVH